MLTLVEIIMKHAVTFPDKSAVIFKKQILSYKELYNCMIGAAACLKGLNVKENDIVLLKAVSKPEYIVALLAIQYIGAVAVPVDKAAKASWTEELYNTTKASLVLTDGQNLDTEINLFSLKELFKLSMDKSEKIDYKKPKEDTIGEILFTSGTTGKPKGGMLSYKAIYASMENTKNGIGMLEDDILLLPLPLNHSYGMRVLRSVLYAGGTLVLQNGFVLAKDTENNIQQYKCTAMACVPASIELISSQMQERMADILGKLRYIEFSAGSLAPDKKQWLMKQLPNTEIHNTWGSTETGGALFLNLKISPDKYYSIGKPIEGIVLKIVDENNCEMLNTSKENPGRMALKGNMTIIGYYNQAELTNETIINGWLYTNDLVYKDDDGYVYMLGRADDMINVGGEKVSPMEVENIASEYEEIEECACLGIKDPKGILGEVPALLIVPKSMQFDESACKSFLAQKLDKYKIPQYYQYTNVLPRNKMKKLDRKAVKNLWEKMGEYNLYNPVVQAIATRRSIRKFTEEKIPTEILETILQAGIYAPSGHNMQTWKFTVLRNKVQIEHLKAVVKEQAKNKKIHFYGFENPETIVLISNDRRNNDGIQDASCAAQNIMLAAHSFGIGSVWLNPLMTLCDEPEIRTILNTYEIPDTHIVWAMIALGYPAEKGRLLAKKQDVIHYIK